MHIETVLHKTYNVSGFSCMYVIGIRWAGSIPISFWTSSSLDSKLSTPDMVNTYWGPIDRAWNKMYDNEGYLKHSLVFTRMSQINLWRLNYFQKLRNLHNHGYLLKILFLLTKISICLIWCLCVYALGKVTHPHQDILITFTLNLVKWIGAIIRKVERSTAVPSPT